MIALPTGARGRILALCLTAAMLGVVWMGMAQPILAWHAERAAMLSQRAMLARRMALLVRELPVLQQQADAAALRHNPAEVLLEGGSDALAGAVLQSRLESMVHDSGVSLASAETLPAQPAGEYRRIALRLSVSGGWAQLVELLVAIERSKPALLVDDLQLHVGALQALRERPRTATSGDRIDPPPLMAVFTVFGFRAGSEATPAQAAAVAPAP